MQSTSSTPAHLAIILDGNGRWAEQRGRPRWMGHVAGARALKPIVEHCVTRGIEQLTVYAMSSDNWSRPALEVNALLELLETQCRTRLHSLVANGVRVSAIGRRDRLPLPMRRALNDLERASAPGRALHLRLAIDYSSRASLQGALPISAATQGTTILPPVDLLLRTGGERRLSDFLLWECAYAELAFIDTLWPDFTPAALDAVLADFATRDRRFGAVSSTRRAS
jgi:undecaprenyl diphosphate synthase